MIYVGIDWGEATNAVAIVDEAGTVLASTTIHENVEGLGQFTELMAEYTFAPGEVVVGTETDHGLLIRTLAAIGYRVYPINPLSANRYRDRHAVGGAKSDPADAIMLANVVRTDRQNHRPMAINSELAESIKVLARRHQDLIWDRTRLCLKLRSTLREYYPGALNAFGDLLKSNPCLLVLEHAATPEQGRELTITKIAAILKAGGRHRNVNEKASEIRQALQAPQLEAPPLVARAHGAAVAGMARILLQTNAEIQALRADLEAAFERHPDAEVIHSLAGLDVVLGARILAEFGDEPNRYADSKSRKRYSGMAPVTERSGKQRTVRRRIAKKRRLSDACYQWANCAMIISPGARACYLQLRSRGHGHGEALRALGNRLVGVLHACIRDHIAYDENVAWPQFIPQLKARSA